MESNTLTQKIRKRFDHQQAKRVLREKYQAKLVFAYNGGMWNAGPELITCCDLCLTNNRNNPVLEDMNQNPVLVDALELKTQALSRWQEQMNAWEVEHNELSKQR